MWGNAFIYINTASGVIENGEKGNISEALLSEARFFRAFDYFRLVQTFGGVPLDLGAGEMKFNTAPTRVSVRNTVPDVYTKAIFPDLKTAIENLPEKGRVTGGVTKTLARLVSGTGLFNLWLVVRESKEHSYLSRVSTYRPRWT